MPSYEQFEELINSNYTTMEWTTVNGVYGRKITSKMSGYTDKYIFLPAAGFCYEAPEYAGRNGAYWSRALGAEGPSARILFFIGGDFGGTNLTERCYGHSVRPVRNQ